MIFRMIHDFAIVDKAWELVRYLHRSCMCPTCHSSLANYNCRLCEGINVVQHLPLGSRVPNYEGPLCL